MRSFQRAFLLLFLLLLPQLGLADDKLFVVCEQIDLTKLLPPPPAFGSAQQKQEIATLLELQKNRTPAQAAFALADAELSVFRFADVIGADFNAEKMPLTNALFKKILNSAALVARHPKAFWDRPRPYVTDPEIQPCVPKPDNASYPSGHSNFGTLSSIILANALPEKQVQIYDRAQAYRFNREIGGAHHPSDIEAGRLSGTVTAAFLLQDKAFLDEFAKAKAEMRSVLGLH